MSRLHQNVTSSTEDNFNPDSVEVGSLFAAKMGGQAFIDAVAETNRVADEIYECAVDGLFESVGYIQSSDVSQLELDR